MSVGGGAGKGVNGRRCGLCKSAFRPSDDACTFPFHIPSNAMAVVEVSQALVCGTKSFGVH
jgi:uncharacterized protein